MTMVVGIDVHVTTTPPFNPLHPYIGMVLDVADYIPFLGTNVSVNGLKRGMSGTGGLILLIKNLGISFIRGRFIFFPKCSCIIGRIWLTLTESLELVVFMEISRQTFPLNY